MQITYYLSFGHQVSYAPPAVPDVLYAASNLAKRGRNNFKTHKKLSNLEYQTKKIIDKNRDIISQENEDMVLNLIIDSISDKVNNLTIKSRNFWA
uniref:Piwi domain-containing protein n=1 Tax=Caenorhabditis japonica TaxID=281687 RepID=A0A8R1EWA4_CAEJA